MGMDMMGGMGEEKLNPLMQFYMSLPEWGQALARTLIVILAAALIGMIPEGLVLLTSTVMAVSVVRLSRRRVLVQELYCIEALARVDVLCLDKTGTLTQGRMELQEVRPCGGVSASQVEQALRALCAASQDDDPTFAALRARYGRAAADGKWAAEQIVPFSSDKKWSGAFFRGRGGYVLGAPEFVLPHGGRRAGKPRVAARAYGAAVCGRTSAGEAAAACADPSA